MPLDVSFMFPLKTYYAQAIEKWLSNNPGRVVTSFRVWRLFNEAYVRAASIDVAVNGFHKKGIIPYNSEVFSEADFISQEQHYKERNDF